MEFKDALLDIYDALVENATEDTTNFGVTFTYEEIPEMVIKLTFVDKDA